MAKGRWIVVGTLAAIAVAVALWARSPGPLPPREMPAVVPDAAPQSTIVPRLEEDQHAVPLLLQIPDEPPATPRYMTDLDGTRVPLTVVSTDGAIRGRVTDRWGKPVAGAQVQFQGAGNTWGTGADGSYFISTTQGPSPYELVATHPNFSDSSPIRAEIGATDANLLLPPLAMITGRVVSALDGQPVTDFRMKPDPAPNAVLPEEGKYERFRDADGRFTLDRVKAGTTAIRVGAKGFADTAIAVPPIIGGEERKNLWVRLNPGAVLRGRVTDSAGRPLKFARITCGEPPRGVVTAADGTFTLDSLGAGPIELTVKHEEFLPKVASTVLGIGAVNRIHIVLAAGVPLAGRFTQGGLACPGGVVVAPAAPNAATATTADGVAVRFTRDQQFETHAREDGVYRFRNIADGRYQVTGTIHPPACRGTWSKSFEITIADGKASTVDFDFAAVSATISGTVFTSPGAPFRERGMVIANYSDFGEAGQSQVNITGEIDDDGSYSICLPVGDLGATLLLSTGTDAETYQTITLNLKSATGQQINRDVWLDTGVVVHLPVTDAAQSLHFAVILLDGSRSPEQILQASGSGQPTSTQAQLLPDRTAVALGLEPGVYTAAWLEFLAPENGASPTQPRVAGSRVFEVEAHHMIDIDLTGNP